MKGFSLYQETMSNALFMIQKQYEDHSRKTDEEILRFIRSEEKRLGDDISIKKMDLPILYSSLGATFPLHELGVLAVITSASLLECLINWVYSVPLSIRGQELEAIQFQKKLEDKWLKLPKKYLDGYAVPSHLKKNLRDLLESRNAIIHHKPEVEYSDGEKVSGNVREIFANKENIIGKSILLPYYLCENMIRFGNRNIQFILWTGFQCVLEKQKCFKGFSFKENESS